MLLLLLRREARGALLEPGGDVVELDLAGLGEAGDVVGRRRVEISAVGSAVDEDGCLETVGGLQDTEVVPGVDGSVGEDDAGSTDVGASVKVVGPVGVGEEVELECITAGVLEELESDQR